MKIESLHVGEFGHFANYDLDLKGAPFALIYGENEAGKSTLLEFVRQILFGFPERTPYKFNANSEIRGSANLSLSDGRHVELRRRKGRKNNLQISIDGKDVDYNESAFRQLLGNANEQVFCNLFAFGLEELRNGEKSLQEESIQSSLFGSGVGPGFHPQKVLDNLDKEMSEIYLKSGKKQKVSLLLSELKQRKSDLKSATCKSDDYETVERELEIAKSRQEDLTRLRQMLTSEQLRLNRIRTAYPTWLELQTDKQQIEQLPQWQRFPKNGLQEFQRLVDAIETHEKGVRELEEDLQQITGQISEARVNESLLRVGEEIGRLHLMVQSAEEARHDLPELENSKENALRQAQLELQKIGGDWSEESVLQFGWNADRDAELSLFVRKFSELSVNGPALERELKSLQADLKDLGGQLAEMNNAATLGDLESLSDQLEIYQADVKEWNRLTEELAETEDDLVVKGARLSPPLDSSNRDWQELVNRPIPSAESIQIFAERFKSIEQEEKQLKSKLADLQEEENEAKSKIDELLRDAGELPSFDDLRESRELRNRAWENFRDDALANRRNSLPDQITTVESAIAKSDELADVIARNATGVAAKAALEGQLGKLRNALRSHEYQEESLSKKRAEFDATWYELWQPSSIQPLSPNEMVSWRRFFNEVAELVKKRQGLKRKSDQSRQLCDSFEQTVLAKVAGDESAARKVSLLRKQVKQGLENRGKLAQLQLEHSRVVRTLGLKQDAISELNSKAAKIQNDWRKFATESGFKSENSVEYVQLAVQAIQRAQSGLLSVRSFDSRISLMRSRVNEFDTLAEKLCFELTEPFNRTAPESSIRSLFAKHGLELETRNKLRLAESARNELQTRLERAQIELDNLRSKLSSLLESADTSDRAIFLEKATTEARREELLTAIDDKQSKLRLILLTDDLCKFEAELAAVDMANLDTQIEKFVDDLHRSQANYDSCLKEVGRLQAEFEKFSGKGNGASIQADIASLQAQLIEQVHRYVPLYLAKQLLQKGIERFEKESQPELLTLVSRIFAKMTAGRYVELERPWGDREEIYVKSSDGQEKTPAQLSTGTREQLYLAIRLGYVEHYCRRTESLPFVIDDALVNFDLVRAEETLKSLANLTPNIQVLYFTCHQYVVDLVRKSIPSASIVEIRRS